MRRGAPEPARDSTQCPPAGRACDVVPPRNAPAAAARSGRGAPARVHAQGLAVQVPRDPQPMADLDLLAAIGALRFEERLVQRIEALPPCDDRADVLDARI